MVYLTESWITRFLEVADKFFHLTSLPVKMWQQILGHKVSHSQRQDRDAFPPVAVRVKLHSLNRWSSNTNSFFSSGAIHQMVAAEGEVGTWSPSSNSHSVSPAVNQCITDWLGSAAAGLPQEGHGLLKRRKFILIFWRWRQFNWLWMPSNTGS